MSSAIEFLSSLRVEDDSSFLSSMIYWFRDMTMLGNPSDLGMKFEPFLQLCLILEVGIFSLSSLWERIDKIMLDKVLNLLSNTYARIHTKPSFSDRFAFQILTSISSDPQRMYLLSRDQRTDVNLCILFV